MNLRKAISIFLFLLPVFNLWSQDYYFVHVIPNETPGRLTYNSMILDRDGVFWIGTSEGLLKFDSQELENLFTEGGQVDITALYQGGNGVIWAGTSDGNVLFVQRDSLIQSDFRSSGIQSKIIAFRESRANDLEIISYANGIWTVDRDSKIIHEIYDPLTDIYCVEEDDYRRLWLGTDRGVDICYFVNDTPHCNTVGAEQGLLDQIVLSISKGDSGHMWLGTFDRGPYYSVSGDSVFGFTQSLWPGGRIVAIANPESGEVWMGTEMNGVFVGDETGEFLDVRLPDKASGQIVGLLPDEEGNIWVLDKYAGLFRTNRYITSFTPQVPDIQSIYSLDGRKVLIGTDAGLYYAIGDSDRIPGNILAPEKANILSMYGDDNGNIWVGSFGQGLFEYDVKRNSVRHYSVDDGLTDESILSIAGFGERIWLATLGGVTELKLNLPGEGAPRFNATNYNHADGLGANFIYCAFVDSEKRVWFGTDGNGLSVLVNNEIVNYSGTDTIEFHSVYSIVQDSYGDIWFSTDGQGVWKFDGTTFTKAPFSRWIDELEIASLATDHQGNLLIATDGTIHVIDVRSSAIRQYKGESGLDGFAPNLNAIHTDQSGNIWIGGSDRIVRYKSLEGPAHSEPRTQIVEVRCDFRLIDVDSQSEFRHDENSFTFSFRGVWYTRPGDVRYKYRLEGVDPDWRNTSDRVVTYQNLKPGKYRFVVMSSISNIFSSGEDSYDFTIKTPVYTRWWFIALVLILFAGIVRGVISQRDNRLRKIADFQKSQIESQFEALKSQINPHFLFNIFNSLMSVIEDDPASAIKYVEKLSDFYRSILEYRDAVDITLKQELHIVDDYVFLLKMRYEENLHVNIDIENLNDRVLPLTLQMLIENAVKHNVISAAKPLSINIFTEDDFIIVKNPLQRRLQSHPSTQFGLQSIAERYELISRKAVEVIENSQYFIVKIPIIPENEHSDHRG